MKKAFMLLLIVLMISLLLNHFFSWTVKENFSDSGDSESTSSMPGSIQVDINSGQHNLVYQNAGEIKQQEKTITDFQSSAENAIKDLSDRVTAFQKVISKNTTDISNKNINFLPITFHSSYIFINNHLDNSLLCEKRLRTE